MDPNGNGTVMNPKGKCVLNIRSSINSSTADVLSEDGNLISRYIKNQDLSSKRNENNLQENIEWNFQGLLILFDPIKWCIYVTFQQSKVSCRFSSISGGEIFSDDQIQSINQNNNINNANEISTTINNNNNNNPKEKKNKKESKEQLISAESHEDIRSGLQSIVSNLDDMLAQMKKK